jgi:osmotically-inducible protein OsmY
MRTRVFNVLAALLFPLCFTHAATAQFGGTGNSAFGSGGGFGNSGFGGGGFGGGGFGGGMGGSSFGSGGFGSGGFGNSGFGGTGGFGNGGFGNSGFGGGNSGFGGSSFGNLGAGGNNQPGGAQYFVGRGGQQNGQNGLQGNRAMNQFFTNMNRSMGRNNRNSKKSSTNQNPPQPMRMEIQVGFTPNQPTPNAVATRIQSRLAKILADHHMSQPLVTVQGDTAVISGSAASDSERQTIAQLVSLEQGVRDVRNEMTVPGDPSMPSEPASEPTLPQSGK